MSSLQQSATAAASTSTSPTRKLPSSPTTTTAAAMDDTLTDDWLDSTNHHVVACVLDHPWNDRLLLDVDYDDDDMMFEASKRVSLDATETWMTENDDFLMAGGPLALDSLPVLPCSISFSHDDEINNMMSMDDDDDDSNASSWHSQFNQRRAQLAASMAASQSTRGLISQHVQTRASLLAVLTEVKRSATQVQQHIVESVGMAVDEEAAVSTTAADATAEEEAVEEDSKPPASA